MFSKNADPKDQPVLTLKRANMARRLAISKWAVTLGVLLAVSVTSCGQFPFEVRSSAAPSGSTSGTIVPATDPDKVVSNLINAVFKRNTEDFGDALADDFTFEADAVDVADLENDYPGIFENWDLQVEKSVVGYIFEKWAVSAELDSVIELNVIEDTQTTHTGQYTYRFILVVNVDDIQTYSGKVLFYMRKGEDGLWSIYRWKDIKVTESGRETWGYTKGLIRATM